MFSQTARLEKGAVWPRPPGCALRACEPREPCGAAARAPRSPALPLRGGQAASRGCAEPPSGERGTEGAGDTFTKGTRSPGSAPQSQQRPLLACRQRRSWGCTLGLAPAHAHRRPRLPAFPTPRHSFRHCRPLLPGRGGRRRRLPHPFLLCCPARPLPGGSPAAPTFAPPASRWAAGSPAPGLLLSRPRRQGGRGCCGPRPARCPPAAAPPGTGALRSRSGPGLAPRPQPSGGSGGKAEGADRGRPAAARALRGRAEVS